MEGTGNNITDQYLVGKLLYGDANAFADIIRRTEKLVAQITFKMISNAEDRKDIAQDIYLKAFKNIRTFKFRSKLSTWIAQIAYNSCVNYLEKKKLVLLDDFEQNEDPSENYHFKMQPFNTQTEQAVFEAETKKILIREIDRLPPLFKTLITLYHHEELSYAEITQITELPEGTVKSYLYRARQQLKNNLLKKYKKEEL